MSCQGSMEDFRATTVPKRPMTGPLSAWGRFYPCYGSQEKNQHTWPPAIPTPLYLCPVYSPFLTNRLDNNNRQVGWGGHCCDTAILGISPHPGIQLPSCGLLRGWTQRTEEPNPTNNQLRGLLQLCPQGRCQLRLIT